MIRVCASSFQHTDHRDILVEPLSNLSVKDRNSAGTLSGFRFLLHLFASDAGNGVAVMASKFSDLDITPAFLFQVVNG